MKRDVISASASSVSASNGTSPAARHPRRPHGKATWLAGARPSSGEVRAPPLARARRTTGTCSVLRGRWTARDDLQRVHRGVASVLLPCGSGSLNALVEDNSAAYTSMTYRPEIGAMKIILSGSGWMSGTFVVRCRAASASRTDSVTRTDPRTRSSRKSPAASTAS